MAAPVNVQLRNAESALLFMQQEHAKTLQGLHQELQKLQKKCAELNFELAMKSGSPDEEYYEKQQKLLEDRLKEKTAECAEVQAEVQKREAKIEHMEQQVKMQEKRHQEEIRQYQQQVAATTNELEQRSSSIAYLTTQLHQLKLRYHSASADDRTPPVMKDRVNSPAPPKDKPHHVRRHKVRSSSIDFESLKGPLRAVHPNNLDSSGLLDYAYATDSAPQQYIVTARRAGSASPHHHHHQHHRGAPPRTDIMDLRPFLAKSVSRSSDVKRPTPPILPPIQPAEDKSRSLLDKRTVFAKRGLHRSNPEFDQTTAMETLAVEKVCSGENDLRHVEQSKTD